MRKEKRHVGEEEQEANGAYRGDIMRNIELSQLMTEKQIRM